MIMKTLFRVTAFLIWATLITASIINPDRLVWKIVFTAGLIYIGWLVIAAIRAPVVEDKYMEL